MSAQNLYVDPIRGGYNTGQRNNPDRPFATLTAAKNAAFSGDTIYVLPGTYHENNLLKDGVNWHFYPGAVVDYTLPQVAFVVIDPAGSDNAVSFDAKVAGSDQNGITVVYVDDGSQSSNTAVATYDATTRTVTVKVKTGTTTSSTVATAVNGITCPVTASPGGGSAGGNGQGTVSPASGILSGGTGVLTSGHVEEYGIFDDRDSAVSCTVSGEGVFIIRDPLKNSDVVNAGVVSAYANGLVYLAQANTSFRLNALQLKCESWMTGAAQIVNILNCAYSQFDIVDLVDLDYGFTASDRGSSSNGVDNTLAPVGSAFIWTAGETYLRFDKITAGSYGIWAGRNLDAAADTNLWVDGSLITAGTSAYWSEGISNNWRTWIHVKEFISTGVGAFNFLSGGKHYIQADKITTSGGSSFDGISVGNYSGHNPTIWLNVQKVTIAAGTGNILKMIAGVVYASILNFEDIATAASAINVAGGELHLTGGYAKVLNGKGVVHSGGIADISGLKVDTSNTNAAGNDAVSVSASGLVLRNCVLISGASAQCVDAATAQTITNYGSVGKYAKGANVTVNVQAILVDVNVA